VQIKPKSSNIKQMMLILNNTSIPVNNESQIYEGVMVAWKGALESMENLIQGVPQRMYNGATLLGISAWHMYPDMVVLKGKLVNLTQNDPLFSSNAPLTLELEDTCRQSVSWSLPLARLQYYGTPVLTDRSAGQDNTRVSANGFSYIMLGCLFAGWKDFAQKPETGLRWLATLVALTEGSNLEDCVKKSDVRFWLGYLHQTAQSLVDCRGVEKQTARQLYQWGRRRTSFLYGHHASPFRSLVFRIFLI
jgi:hypothetical protein